ncbi:hypothetical protein GON26_07550 [Flavobacterium sp. GA093]|uniref:DUF2157 domain-containing protein n=1 Tax=Flavobacterium hydrocarbonoxydans TaxID=2683249 RepID=A0A6I4NJP0_9FLAO|nr:hypothetical protein [Flavobacterium hydrocarbonoxydans]MWB94213.1 hypothetical protein [Flavobacterium hydrocarbonoxydans]
MMVHDTKLLEDLALLEEANSLLNAGFINKEQFNSIKKELPDFKQNSILVQIGFFFLGVFLYSSICCAISLLGIDGSEVFWKICFYIFTIIGITGAEFLAKEKYYQHGLDDAFIVGTILNFGIAVGITSDGYELVIAIFVALISFLMYRRYLYTPAMLIFCCAFTAVLFYGLFEFGEIGKTILPFVAMLTSLGFYFFSKKAIKDLKEKYYYNGLLLINSFCLILFYLSCNYLVVRELSVMLLDNEIRPGEDIPFAFFFWSFTAIVPLVYLYQAIKIHDRIMLWISFLAIAFSIFTIRTYHSVLPIEIALALGGVALFAVAYLSIQKLKYKETGLTFKPDRINNSNAINAEALIVASTFGMKPEVKPQNSPMEFGGGGFSGGGSDGSF